MKKDLVIFEINECDFEYFAYGSKKYNYPLIKKFFKKKNKIKTYTKDNIEGLNLDPWVQWVSVHTGLPSKKHRVFRMGQKIPKNVIQFWEKIAKKNFTISLWGLFNSSFRLKKNINMFIPDPWSFTQKAYPENLSSYLKLPRFYAKNYPNVEKFTILLYGVMFLKKILFTSIFFYILKNSLKFLKIFIYVGLKSFNLYFFLDLISLHILKKEIKFKKSDITIIALNSFAHYQHNFWDEKKNESYYFWYLNEMVKVIYFIDNHYSSSIVFNGFEQKKINPEYAVRPKNFNTILDLLCIKYSKIEPNMTTGATIFFDSIKDKFNTKKILNEIYFYEKHLFYLIDFKNEKKIFFKFNLIFNTNDLKIIMKSKSSFKVINLSKDFSLKTESSLIKKILENCIFIKSTSVHKQNGTIFAKNFLIEHNNTYKLENHKLSKYILNHFDIIKS